MDTRKLLDILACPRCLGRLEALPGPESPEGFSCPRCRCVYPIREEIPVMLVEESVDRVRWDLEHGAGAKR